MLLPHAKRNQLTVLHRATCADASVSDMLAGAEVHAALRKLPDSAAVTLPLHCRHFTVTGGPAQALRQRRRHAALTAGASLPSYHPCHVT